MKTIRILLTGLIINLLLNCQAEVLETKNLTIALSNRLNPKIELELWIEKFKKEHLFNEINLIYFDPQNIPEMIKNWQSGYSEADLYIGGDLYNLVKAVQHNVLEPLDSLLKENLSVSKFLSAFLHDVYFTQPEGEGGYYPMLPFMGEALMIGVNTDILKKAGYWRDGRPAGLVKLNKTDLANFLFALQPYAPDGALLLNFENGFTFYNFVAPLLALQGSFLNSTKNGFELFSEDAQEWLIILKNLIDDKLIVLVNNEEEARQLWKKGRVGAYFNFQTKIMELGFQTTKPISIVGFSAWDGSEINGSIMRTRSVWIPKAAKSKNWAKLFIKEIIFSAEFQQNLFNRYGWLPALRIVYNEGIKKMREYSPLFLALGDNSLSTPLWLDFPTYIEIFEKYFISYLNGKMSLADACRAIQTETEGLNYDDSRIKN